NDHSSSSAIIISPRLFSVFSSRRRHTSSKRDWSSDVCSSDLGIGLFIAFIGFQNAGIIVEDEATLVGIGDLTSPTVLLAIFGLRSEERRVGKEGRSRGLPAPYRAQGWKGGGGVP